MHDITTQHASSGQVAGTVFIQGSGKMVPSGSHGTPPKVVGKGVKWSTKGEKGQKWCPQWVAATTGCDDDDEKN
jgi:hypothetical protein